MAGELLIYVSHSMLEEDSQGFKPSALCDPSTDPRKQFPQLNRSIFLLPVCFPHLSVLFLLCEKPWCLRRTAAQLIALSLSVQRSSSVLLHYRCVFLRVGPILVTVRALPEIRSSAAGRSGRPGVEAEKYLWKVGDVERINRQCSLRFVSLLNQSGKASENTFYFAITIEGNRKQANLVFHQDQNHRQD